MYEEGERKTMISIVICCYLYALLVIAVLVPSWFHFHLYLSDDQFHFCCALHTYTSKRNCSFFSGCCSIHSFHLSQKLGCIHLFSYFVPVVLLLLSYANVLCASKWREKKNRIHLAKNRTSGLFSTMNVWFLRIVFVRPIQSFMLNFDPTVWENT